MWKFADNTCHIPKGVSIVPCPTNINFPVKMLFLSFLWVYFVFLEIIPQIIKYQCLKYSLFLYLTLYVENEWNKEYHNTFLRDL